MKSKPMLLVHGGAWDIPRSMHHDHQLGMEKALQIGIRTLRETNDPLKTVLEVIKYLEDDPTFDAGRGSFLNSAGQVEMDAGIMLGKDLSAGAVAAIQNVRHPIEVAEAVRRHTQHVLLAGEGAMQFARQQKLEMISTENLLVGRERERYEALKTSGQIRIKSFFEEQNSGRDTVGAVAVNDRGEIAAGTSTGGTPHKLQGRVGDSPLIGAGFYADDRKGGASSTGWGEGIMRVVLAKRAVDLLGDGKEPHEAAQMAIDEMSQQVSGNGGIILLNQRGEYGYAFNTPCMACGAADRNDILFISVSR